MKVLISSHLYKHDKRAFDELTGALKLENVSVEFLDSKNIWLRDFMPIQLINKCVKFRYKKDFKTFKRLEVKDSLWDKLSPLVISPIALDGGNCVIDGDRVYMTTIISRHNRRMLNAPELVDEIEETLNLRVIQLPLEPHDDLGHAGGIIRPVGDNTVLINNYSCMKKKNWRGYQQKVEKILNSENISYDLMPFAYNKCPDPGPYEFAQGHPLADDYKPAVGYYINYLAIGAAAFVPQFDLEEDEEAVAKLEEYYERVYPIHCVDLAMEGGLLNCVTREYL
jgi:agmatine/peptidylarginine deiminase